jgi:Glycosyltransferase family 92
MEETKHDSAGGRPRAYLAACMMFRDHASYLREWVEFHRLVGVERLYLYDNGSSDDPFSTLAPYIEDGLVVPHHFPKSFPELPYVECLDEHRSEARWIAFIDVDEFLFSPTFRPLPDVLREYEEFGAVGVNHAVFGTSGHRERPPGLVIESYLSRADDHTTKRNRRYKSIVDPSRVAYPETAHHFVLHDATTVDERRRPVSGALTETVSFSRLRINHYVTKSAEEYREKTKIRSKFSAARAWEDLPALDERLSAERDETITFYVPALKDGLARMEARAASVDTRGSRR